MFKLKSVALAALALLAFTSCENDEPNAPVVPKKETKVMKEINAKEHSNWVYINLETGQTESHRDFTAWFYIDPKTKERVVIPAQGSLSDVKIAWHIALRRNLVKTNEGSVATTGGTDFDKAQLPANPTFVADAVESKNPMIIDFSAMMSGKATFSTEDKRNPLLSNWVKRSGAMPNFVYTPTNEVFVLRTKEGKLFKLQFTDFLNAKGNEKGIVTFKVMPLGMTK
ncbi:MAG: HmuY family protein [Bacteroidales bacterium]|nr:HmuY family protein [Bacteroidales bacterium]